MTSSVAPNTGGMLTARRALVTGAAGRIGGAIAAEYEAAGATVVRTDRAQGHGILACDVTDEASVAAAFDAAAGEGPVTDVVHAAGVLEVARIEETSVARFREVIDVNLVGTFVVAREAARRLGRGGHIVLVASQAGLLGGALWGTYCASKAGMLRLGEALVQELAERGVRVNAVSPGNVATPMGNAAIERIAREKGITTDDVRANYLAGIPLGRFAEPEEIGRAVVALASGLMSYANGMNMILDGGEMSP